MAGDTPNNGTATEDFASIDDALGSFAEDDDNEDRGQGSDTQLADGGDGRPTDTDAPDGGEGAGEDFADVDGDAGDGQDDGTDDPNAGDAHAVYSMKVPLEDGTETTVAELVRGNLRQGDYSRKTAELSTHARALQEQSTGLETLAAQLQEQREVIAELAGLLQPMEPDEGLLRSGNMVAYELQKRAFERQTKQIEKLMSDFRGEKARQEGIREQRRKDRRTMESRRLAARVPAFFDADGRRTEAYNTFWREAVASGQHYGFTRDDLDRMTDHRHYLVLRDALEYRKIRAKAKQRTKEEPVNGQRQGNQPPPVLRSGKRGSPNAARLQARQAASARLDKTGSIHDAMHLID